MQQDEHTPTTTYGAAPISLGHPPPPRARDRTRYRANTTTAANNDRTARREGERAWLLGGRSSVELTSGTTAAGEGASRARSRSGTSLGLGGPGSRWSFTSLNQQPINGGAHGGYGILPTSAVGGARSSADLNRRGTIKEVPGQTQDPQDPLNRATSTVRDKMVRQESSRSTVTLSSFANNYNGSISARRSQLHRQNSFGVEPNLFWAFVYWLKELTTSTDTTDEKITSTVLNVVNVMVDTIFCGLYLVEASYLTRPEGHESNWLYIQRSAHLWHVLVAIATYNFITVCCSIVFSDSKLDSVKSVRHIISTVVAVPFIVSVFIEDGQNLYVPYFLQSFALISRIQQALNFYIDMGVSDLPMDPLKSKTIIFGLYIIGLIYCAISAFQVAEYDQLMNSDDHNDLLKLLYFVLITMSTVGYGDLTPKNQVGYAIVVLLIMAVVSVFPFMISGIMDALAQAKAGEGIFKSGGNKFMIISGSLHSAQKLANVLNGFWFTNKEYSNAAFKIVIFGLNEPSKEIQALLHSARYKNRVVYLKGTPLENKDLERIQARHAEGIFIIADRNSPFSPQEEDRHNTLSTLAFRNVSNAGIYTYNLLPETEIYQKMAATQVVCADELRQVLLAFNCLQQATATLVLNLLHQHRPSEKFTEAWEAEYDDSLGNEFYISYLNPIFDGKPFGFVSWFLYRRFQVILFGVRIRLQSGEYHTALNPGKDYRFQHNEQCIFIAQNPTDLEDINELSEKNLENFLDHLRETQPEDDEDIGADYHAKNFSNALLTLRPRNHCARRRRKAKSTQRTLNDDVGATAFTRHTGRYALHSAMPIITTTEEDEIDCEPEVCLMSGPEDEEGGACSAPASPKSKQVVSDQESQKSTLKPSSMIDKVVESKSTLIRESRRKSMPPDEHTTELRIGYPEAPFAGAKLPLCILVDARHAGERKVADMIISNWNDVLEIRREKAMEVEAERRAQRPRSSSVSGQDIRLTVPDSSEAGESQSSAAAGTSRNKSSSSSKAAPEPGHILICSPSYDIFRLICTLRSAHLKQILDVVILCPRQPTTQEFKILKCFPRLFFLIGDCLSRDDLERGAITKSSKYLFMRHPNNGGVDGSFFDSAAVINRILVQQIFSDVQIAKVSRLPCAADNVQSLSNAPFNTTTAATTLHGAAGGRVVASVPTKKTVSLNSLNEGPQCVYELVEERSVDYLQIRKAEISIERDSHCGIGAKPTYLEGAGGAFGPESDSGYYGLPQHQQHSGAVPRRKPISDTSTDFYHNPIYASGGVLVGGLLDHVLYQLYSNPSILQLIKLLCGIQTKEDVKRDFHLFKQYGAGCHLECISVPEGFGVQTMRPHKDDSSSSSGSSSGSSGASSSDDDDDEETAGLVGEGSGKSGKSGKKMNDKKDKKKKDKKSKHQSSFSRAASNGKKRISELFNHNSTNHGHSDSDGSIDSDYIYDNRHKNFLHLYEHLALDQGVIPIGLLRLQGDDPKTVHLGIGGSSRCYAITNPLLDTIVLDTDQVFILTREHRN
ncbi:potassium channel, sub T, member 1 [Mortierella sp. NVP41]|nr:potassium channel, sub T, member 1 [Mortierella sp. NVP41]